MTTNGAPAARYDHTAVWTGSEMIVWGGYGSRLSRTPAGATIRQPKLDGGDHHRRPAARKSHGGVDGQRDDRLGRMNAASLNTGVAIIPRPTVGRR